MKKLLMNKFPLILLIIYLIEFLILAINPYSRTIWITENSFSVAIVIVLIIFYWRGIKFSNVAYSLMWLYLCLILTESAILW